MTFAEQQIEQALATWSSYFLQVVSFAQRAEVIAFQENLPTGLELSQLYSILENFLPDALKTNKDRIIQELSTLSENNLLTQSVAVALGLNDESKKQFFDIYQKGVSLKEAQDRRLFSLLEQIQQDKQADQLRYKQPLNPLSPFSLFPSETSLGQTYKVLWDQFIHDLKKIPLSHHKNLNMWLDHFDSLWQIYAQAMPAVVSKAFISESSAYDLAKVSSALMLAKKQALDTNTPYLLIQGDFFGIQNFIFASGGDTVKHAAKLLRGRSFYVSLMVECAALKIVEKLGLNSSSIVQNAAGKFLIVAGNTTQNISFLEKIQTELNEWFLKYTYGLSSLGLAWTVVDEEQFKLQDTDNNFQQVMKKLFAVLERKKLSNFDLCASDQRPAVFEGYLDSFDNRLGVCELSGFAPATMQFRNSVAVSDLSRDHVIVGEALAKPALQRLIISKESIDQSDKSLKVSLFGYSIRFTEDEEISGKFGPSIQEHKIQRFYDFSLAQNMEDHAWHGYAKRHINSYVPVFNSIPDALDLSRYPESERNIETGVLKNFNHLAYDNKQLNENSKWQGIAALAVLKGDIDNLGTIFQQGQKRPSFTKSALLSRQVNAFFAVYLPALCKEKYRNSYTVFAGGDDFFLIGPWYEIICLAAEMRNKFHEYCANNEKLHFSAGVLLTKPGAPVNQLAERTESALELAKNAIDPQGEASKNNVYCLEQVMKWSDFEQVVQACHDLKDIQTQYGLSTAFLYALLTWCDMAEQEHLQPEMTLWRSQLYYKIYRHLESLPAYKGNKDALRKGSSDLAVIFAKNLEKFKGRYRVAVTTHLYRYRKSA